MTLVHFDKMGLRLPSTRPFSQRFSPSTLRPVHTYPSAFSKPSVFAIDTNKIGLHFQISPLWTAINVFDRSNVEGWRKLYQCVICVSKRKHINVDRAWELHKCTLVNLIFYTTCTDCFSLVRDLFYKFFKMFCCVRLESLKVLA